uniref:DEK-C domain-containing protein n=1 Tax=Tetradesmus obliquus TaxID=3088 RepID=A0A383V677_TETOB|eukprot:jgi/Sobl393_1/9728/SZX61098.1
MSATSEQVKTAVRALLRKGVDLNTTTERQIREELAQQIGSVEAHKKIIKEEIDTYLTETYSQSDPAAAAAPAAEDAADAAQEPAPGAKRKRTPDAAGSAAAQPAKERRPAAAAAAAAAGDLPGIQLCERSLLFASVNTFKGQTKVDLRQYYQAKDSGKLAPTKKGVALNAADWAAVQAVLPQLQAAVEAGNDQFYAELPNDLRATTSTFQRKLVAGIREYYSDGGDMKPGMKGINLTPDALDALIAAVPQLNQQLGPAAAAAAAAAAPAAARKPAAVGSAAAAAPAAAAAGSSGAEEVPLGGRKRAAVSVFQGRLFMDLREMYEKDSQQLPGKKGIALKPEEWRKVCDAAEAISSAHGGRDTRYKLDLGSKRQVAISEFKGTYYVNVREFYEKNGELLPGSKGLSMTGEQWGKLVAGMPGLNAQLEKS